jgi:hypothetical protein
MMVEATSTTTLRIWLKHKIAYQTMSMRATVVPFLKVASRNSVGWPRLHNTCTRLKSGQLGLKFELKSEQVLYLMYERLNSP